MTQVMTLKSCWWQSVTWSVEDSWSRSCCWQKTPSSKWKTVDRTLKRSHWTTLIRDWAWSISSTNWSCWFMRRKTMSKLSKWRWKFLPNLSTGHPILLHFLMSCQLSSMVKCLPINLNSLRTQLCFTTKLSPNLLTTLSHSLIKPKTQTMLLWKHFFILKYSWTNKLSQRLTQEGNLSSRFEMFWSKTTLFKKFLHFSPTFPIWLLSIVPLSSPIPVITRMSPSNSTADTQNSLNWRVKLWTNKRTVP